MGIFKAYESYIKAKVLDLSEDLKKVGAGVDSDPTFIDSPFTGIVLTKAGTLLIDTHNAKKGGTDLDKQKQH